MAYHDNELRVGEATSTRKRTSNSISNKSRRPSVVVNNYPENQHLNGRRFTTSESKFLKNYWLHKAYAQLKSFPGGTSFPGVKSWPEITWSYRILISCIVANNKLASAYTLSVNQHISNMYLGNSFVFIDNNNIRTSSLFRDGLRLLEIGKRILANNFIDNLNNFLRIRKTHRSPP